MNENIIEINLTDCEKNTKAVGKLFKKYYNKKALRYLKKNML